ncbi:butyrophilin-like protein [Pimephales promelas]|nr:butyrophilin-like protein [Pimephales promelas]
MHLQVCVLVSVLLTADGFIVRGPSAPLVAPLGTSVVLPCYVDKPLPMKDLEVEWRRADSETHLYPGESRPEVQQQDYQDRAHFFTDQIQHGNFSLRLDNLRAEDEGNYTCKVNSQQDSGETVVQIKIYNVERLLVSGSSRSISASVGEDVTLNWSVDSHVKPEHIEEVSWRKTDEDEDIPVLLYQNNKAFPASSYEQHRHRDSATKHVRTLGFLHVFLPNVMMFVAFLLWGLTEGFLYETIFCCVLYILRPLMVIFVAPYLKKIPELCLLSEFIILMLVYFSVLFSHAWRNIIYYEWPEKIRISMFVVVILLCVIFIICLFTENMEMPCCGEIWKRIWRKVSYIVYYSFFILPTLQFILLFTAFGNAPGGFIVSMIFPLFFFLSFSCLRGINKGKICSVVLNITLWLIVMFIMTAVTVYYYSTSLKREKDAAGWTCTAVFLQLLWMIAMYIRRNDLDLTFTFHTKKTLYVFGSVGVVLLNSVTLMTELILKTVNGKRAFGDLRVVLFSSESIFAFSLLILSMFGPLISDTKCWQCCQKAATTDDIPVTELNQSQDSQNAEASDEASASGSNQNQNSSAESHEMNPLLNLDQEAGKTDKTSEPCETIYQMEENQPDSVESETSTIREEDSIKQIVPVLDF